ncbi:helix-turn-helix transcriptional regulator [Cohnella algarum]|nr:helix-turn-helix transcriptional regulator [Cohnella algarum]
MRIARRIEYVLEKRGIKKSELAAQTGVSTGNLGDWKRGKSAPGAIALIEISKFLGVSVDWLLAEGEPSYELKEGSPAYFFGEKLQSDCSDADLTDEERSFIREYIEFARHRRQRGKN